MSESQKSKRLRAKKLARIRLLRGIKEVKKALKELETPFVKEFHKQDSSENSRE